MRDIEAGQGLVFHMPGQVLNGVDLFRGERQPGVGATARKRERIVRGRASAAPAVQQALAQQPTEHDQNRENCQSEIERTALSARWPGRSRWHRGWLLVPLMRVRCGRSKRLLGECERLLRVRLLLERALLCPRGECPRWKTSPLLALVCLFPGREGRSRRRMSRRTRWNSKRFR